MELFKQNIGDRIRLLRKNKGYSQEDFASLIGIGRSNLSRIEKGEYFPGKAQLIILVDKLSVNPRWLQDGELPIFLSSSGQVKSDIPILADIPAGDWKYWIDSYTAGGGDEFLCVPDIKGSDLFAVRVKGDSMEPRIQEGDILIVDPHKKFIKDIAVVRHHWGYKVRLVHKHNDTYILTPLNSKYDVESITPDEDTRLYVPVKRISVQNL